MNNNIQKLEQQIKDAQKKLKDAETQLQEIKIKSYGKHIKEDYIFVTEAKKLIQNTIIKESDFSQNIYYESEYALVSIKYFRTKEEAVSAEENLLIHQQLQQLALELNNGVEINWDNSNQRKWSIYYSLVRPETVMVGCSIHSKHYNKIYCLNKLYKDAAIKLIGRERLVKYLKGEKYGN